MVQQLPIHRDFGPPGATRFVRLSDGPFSWRPIDFDKRMAVSYVMNQMIEQGPLGDDRGLSIVMAAYGGL